MQSMTKAEKRAAAKAAAARAAARRRRTRVAAGALAGLAVIGLLVTVFLVVNRPGGEDRTAGATASPTADGGFPQLPAGADPALATKPTAGAGAGTGEVSKLTVTPLIEGTGPAAAAGQNITVNYVGVSFKTGGEFDASWQRSAPFSFQLGAGKVIPGWDQGLVGVKLGSRVQLDIPSDLAYGDHPQGGRPAGALRFVVDVLGLQ
jgi:peptidylprolyl isomerase